MTWTHYLLQVNIYLVIFYAFYRLLLDKETYFTLNRAYLLLAGLLSLIIPFIQPEWFMRQAAAPQISAGIGQLNMMMAQVSIAPDETASFNWGRLLAGIYLAGTVYFSLRLIWQLFKVKQLVKIKPQGAAFSFFHTKVIDPALPGLAIINQHEEIHIRQLHSLDVLFYELLGILVWCNPVIYAYQTAVKNTHEYLADEVAASFQGDKESYALLLLSKAFGVDQNVLTNSFFNKSLLKKRIFMLHQQRSTKTAVLKYGLFLPLFAATLLFSSATISSNEELLEVADKITVPLSVTLNDETEQKHPETSAGDWAPFYQYLSKSIRYPSIASGNKVQGNTLIRFTVRNGKVSDITSVLPLGSDCDTEVISAINGYNGFGNVSDGKYSIPVKFRLSNAKTAIKNTNIRKPVGYTELNAITVLGNAGSAASGKDKIYAFTSVVTPPSFEGGMDGFYHYLAKNIKYPKTAIDKNIQGKVFLSFIVEATGELTEVTVEKGLGYGLDEEAARVMKESPKWKPGYDKNGAVRVKYNMPISFTLDNTKPDKKVQNSTSGQSPESDTQKYAVAHSGNTDKQITLKNSKNVIYIIDGVRSYKNEIETIKVNDITSVNILNDENALKLYGDDAKNGVVLITTKDNAQNGNTKKTAPKSEPANPVNN